MLARNEAEVGFNKNTIRYRGYDEKGKASGGMESTKIGRGRRASYAKSNTARSKGNEEGTRRDKREKRNRDRDIKKVRDM